MEMLPSGLPEVVGDEEDLARFLTHHSLFNTTIVKPAALLPSPRDRETSVSRHGREPIEELRQIGRNAAGTRDLYGAAVFKARVVRVAALDVVADEPPPRHAVICGWPWNDSDPEMQKAQQKEMASVIASSAGPPTLL